MKLSHAAVALLLAPLAFTASAGEATFSVMASNHLFDTGKLGYAGAPTQVRDGDGYAIGLGYRLASPYGIEVMYGRTRSELDVVPPLAATNVRDTRLSLDGYRIFNAGAAVSPYILLGGGEQRFKPFGAGPAAAGSVVNAGTFANAAVGAFFNLTQRVAIRAEARDVYTFDTENNDVLVMLGLTFKGASANTAVTEEPVVAPEPAPVVEEPAPVVAPVVDADSDNDGVADSKDKCPNTPAGVAVDQNGCPLDADNDGVPDYLDKCPDTAANVVVDKEGCAVTLTEDISKDIKINFDSGKAVVKDEYKGDIADVAKLAQQYPTAFVEIQGHTDSSGNANLNTKLSQSRADAVKEVLVNEYGIDASRVTATGYGSSQPVADNKTVEGRAENRRVVAVLSGKAKRVQMKQPKKK